MGRSGWWIWVTAGVAWGLLCVGVRHAALLAGIEMEQLVVQRSEEVARVQALERASAEAQRLESIERLAAGQGFMKAPASRVVIIAPEKSEGLLARWFGGGSAAGNATLADGEPRVNVRPREEVMTAKKSVKKPAKKTPAGPHKRNTKKR